MIPTKSQMAGSQVFKEMLRRNNRAQMFKRMRINVKGDVRRPGQLTAPGGWIMTKRLNTAACHADTFRCRGRTNNGRIPSALLRDRRRQIEGSSLGLVEGRSAAGARLAANFSSTSLRHPPACDRDDSTGKDRQTSYDGESNQEGRRLDFFNLFQVGLEVDHFTPHPFYVCAKEKDW